MEETSQDNIITIMLSLWLKQAKNFALSLRWTFLFKQRIFEFVYYDTFFFPSSGFIDKAAYNRTNYQGYKHDYLFCYHIVTAITFMNAEGVC